jgi:hypothetical protein
MVDLQQKIPSGLTKSKRMELRGCQLYWVE